MKYIILFYISVVFLCGRIFGLYKLTMPENNVIVEAVKCIWVSFYMMIPFEKLMKS